MKKKLLFIVLLLGFINSNAAIYEVKVNTSGTLLSQLGSDIESIDSIKIVGNLNTNDMLVLKKMTISHKLIYIDLYETNAEIGSNAFEGSNGLRHIILPKNCTSIGYLAFAHCTNLKRIILGKKVSYLANGCLRGCYSLKEITLPKTVNSIGTQCFDGGTCFDNIYCEGSTPPSASTNAWGYFGSTVHVPIGCKSTYEFANGWMNFNNIVEYRVENTHNISYEIEGNGNVIINGNINTYNPIVIGNDEETIISFVSYNGWLFDRVEINGKDETSQLTNGQLVLVPDECDIHIKVTFVRHFDVGHITNIINLIMNGDATNADFEAYDINNDGELNIGDVILIVKFILNHGDSNPSQARRRAGEVIDLTQYTAAQFEVKVTADTNIKDIRLVQSLMQTHQLIYQKKDANTYAVVVFSLSNQLMNPEKGNIIEIETDNDNLNELSIEDVIVAKPTGETNSYLTLPVTTGIQQTKNENSSAIIYDLKGYRLFGNKELIPGLYIVNGKKTIVR